ncbi:MAG: Uma2 family endonuclease, partial [Oscillatoriales cyanobacterium]
MTQSLSTTGLPPAFPDHTQLPESDGTFVKNFQEHPQSILLTDSLEITLQRLHPDGQYAIGQDCGIYWRETDPPEKGAEAPDWFYVPNVGPLVDGEIRRSYVIWREYMVPIIAIEFARKPGKFWVYEQIIRIPYYAIYVIKTSQLEVYNWVNGCYCRLEPNDRGHYPIDRMGIELGLWEGSYQNQTQRWLRWWDNQGNLLLTGSEQARLERLHTEQERQRAEAESQRAEAESQRAEAESQRAEAESQRADRAQQTQQDAIPQLLAMGLTVEQVAQALSLS